MLLGVCDEDVLDMFFVITSLCVTYNAIHFTGPVSCKYHCGLFIEILVDNQCVRVLSIDRSVFDS